MVRICSAGDQLSAEKGILDIRIEKRREEMGRGRRCVLTLQHIQADAAQLVDVRVEDLGEEADLGRGHGIVIWKEELEFKDATWGLLILGRLGLGKRLWTFVWRLCGAVNLDVKVSEVVFVWNCADARDAARR